MSNIFAPCSSITLLQGPVHVLQGKYLARTPGIFVHLLNAH
jgi:hypothetical protein